MSITEEKLVSKIVADTVFNTVTAMASRLERYNHTDTNLLVSIIVDRMYNYLIAFSVTRITKYVYLTFSFAVN